MSNKTNKTNKTYNFGVEWGLLLYRNLVIAL